MMQLILSTARVSVKMVAGGFMVSSVSAAPARASAFIGARFVAAPARPVAGNAFREVTCMAKKAKDIRPTITLECTEQKASGVAGISRYTTEKARRGRCLICLAGLVGSTTSMHSG